MKAATINDLENILSCIWFDVEVRVIVNECCCNEVAVDALKCVVA